jgi:hypothetical protein
MNDSLNDQVIDTDYTSAITRKWNSIIYELDECRARKVDLGIRIKALVEEKRNLRPLVRRVAPELVTNGDEATPDE